MRHRSVPVEAAYGGVRCRRFKPLVAGLVLLACVAASAAAQAPSEVPNPPPFYAITNARIVTVSGAVEEAFT